MHNVNGLRPFAASVCAVQARDDACLSVSVYGLPASAAPTSAVLAQARISLVTSTSTRGARTTNPGCHPTDGALGGQRAGVVVIGRMRLNP
jgi:hypothetical protein